MGPPTLLQPRIYNVNKRYRFLLIIMRTRMLEVFRTITLFKLGVPDVAGLARTIIPACLSSFQTVPDTSCIS